jgi:hypothetical protein
MIAKRLPTMLPPIAMAEAIETTKIHSTCGLLNGSRQFVTERPSGELSPRYPVILRWIQGRSPLVAVYQQSILLAVGAPPVALYLNRRQRSPGNPRFIPRYPRFRRETCVAETAVFAINPDPHAEATFRIAKRYCIIKIIGNMFLQTCL